MPFPLTEEQRRAVENRGGALLVSAAAGSGKTRVLVERLLDRVTRQEADIDRFLVITYTKAAAAELRGRIAQELNERLALEPDSAHLRRQTTLVYRAQISTVHAFCAQMLRQSAARLEVDPDFRLCDEGEGVVLRRQVLDRLMDQQYEDLRPDSDFARLVDTLGAGRDDSRLMDIVLDVYDRVQSHPDPEGWLEDQGQAWELDGVSDAARTPWGAQLMDRARQQAGYWLERLGAALDLAGGDPVLLANYGPSLEQSIHALMRFGRAESWDDMAALLPIPFPAAGRKRGEKDEQLAKQVKDLRARAKKQLDRLAEDFDGTSAQLLDELRAAAPAVRGLTRLVGDFSRAYAAEKSRRGVADFSDLEHMAVRLLYDGQTGEMTDLARDWSDRFDEVMVDEFQDTNQVQNAIFRALSNGGRKLFMVGDVKQSIYRFRMADPTIFLGRYNAFPFWDEAAPGQPRKMLLKRNFRSRPEVLEGVNDLFRDVMSPRLGEMEYSDDQALVPGGTFPEGGDCRVVLDVVDLGRGETGEGAREDRNLLEARNAARRIRRMLDEGFPVSAGEGTRPMEPSDVMILLRSPGPVLGQYIQALWEQDIPWSADTGDDFFAATEVNVALSLLRIVDNPRQDVALISALRSPVYGFSGDRLAQLRAGAEGDFYSAVARAAQEGAEDCRAFLEELDELRFGAGDRTCSQLIWHIYERTNLLGLFSALPDGDSRRDRLLTLYEVARQQEGAGCRTLFDFLLRLDRLRQSGQKVGALASRTTRGVRILSIHRSKGLEAPVVLVCGLGRQFNREDLHRPVLFHSRLGVGPKYVDTRRRLEMDTLARRAVASALEGEMMAEELRLLYVAMTRAREKLILSTTIGRRDKSLSDLARDADSPVAPQALLGCTAPGQWVLLSALTRRSGQPLREAAGLGWTQADYTMAWDVNLIDASGLEDAPERTEGRLTAREEAPLDGEELLAGFVWQYGHQAAADTPSKVTATQLKGRHQDQEAARDTVQPRPAAPLYRPDFAARKLGLTPAQRGTALHLVMQYMDFEKTRSLDEIKGEIRRLVDEEFITDLQAQAVRPERLLAFFRSGLGQELLGADRVHREFKFSILVDAADYCPGVEGEQVLLQGVIDCWFEKDGRVTVVDFKSDRVDEHTVAGRAEEYRPQITAYSSALERMLGRKVDRRVLWFLTLDRGVEL